MRIVIISSQSNRASCIRCQARQRRARRGGFGPHLVVSRLRRPVGVAEAARLNEVRIDPLGWLTPRLKPYLPRPNPSWPDIVNAADWLRHELKVPKSLWGDACITMGRRSAAMALAIVSTKNTAHFRTSPGGYFSGIVAKAKTGELHLERTVWALRRATQPERYVKPTGH